MTISTLRDMWMLNLRRFPRELATASSSRRFTFRELTDRAAKLAGALRELGVGHQDRVCMISMNRTEWFDFYCAAEIHGFIAAPLNFRLAAPELAALIQDAAPKVVIFEAQLADTIASIREQFSALTFVCIGGPAPTWARDFEQMLLGGDTSRLHGEPAPTDIVRLLYTSGTTGRSKGVARSQAADLAGARGTYVNLGLRPISSSLMMMPLYHLGAQVISASMHWGGGAVHVMTHFDAAEALSTIARERIEMTLMAPVMVQRALEAAESGSYDLSSLYLINYSAAPMPVPLLKRAIEVFGPIFANIYGQTESGQGTIMYPRQHHPDGNEADLRRLTSVGMENQFVSVRIVDAEDRDCAPGVPGEILLKTDSHMSYYWNNAAATIETLNDHWIRTGDIGAFDEDRFVYLVDRKKDMIISGGENIYSREVENALISHPAVADVAVIGVPDETWGEAVKAIVVLKKGANVSEDELRAHCRQLLAKFKCPKSFAFVEDLPRLPSGKVHKPTLKQLFKQ